MFDSDSEDEVPVTVNTQSSTRKTQRSSSSSSSSSDDDSSSSDEDDDSSGSEENNKSMDKKEVSISGDCYYSIYFSISPSVQITEDLS